MAWNPEQYERFRDEREAPFWDLHALLREQAGMHVVDLGCGSGRLTRELHRRLGAASTLGIDASASMLAGSEEQAAPGLAFERADIAEFDPGRTFDLVFSNAALHWLPDPRAAIERITAWVAPGGQLAVGVPANFDGVSHTTADEVAREAPFAAALDGWVRGTPVLAPEEYARVLDRLGYAEQHVRLQVYPHVLGSVDGIVEWVKGTLLTPFAEGLGEELFGQFLERYRARLRDAVETRADGSVFFPFKRILAWAKKP